MSIEYHMMRWRRWNLLRNGTPQGARCNLGRWAQSTPDADDVAPLSDDEAEAVNQALSALKARYPDAHRAIVARYVEGAYDSRGVARRCGISQTAAKVFLREGYAFLDGAVARG